MKIKKVLNNNVILATNHLEQEYVIIRNGIGFKRKPGDFINEDNADKVFVFENKESIHSVHELLNNISLQDIELASEIIEWGKSELPFDIHDNILITLSDHISYMLKRLQKGLYFGNPLQWEIEAIYPQEYIFSQKVIEFLEKKTGFEIPRSEISFIALHFANAHSQEQNMQETIILTKIIDQILNILKEHYQIIIDSHSYELTRFITHLRYFVNRQINGQIVLEQETYLLPIIEQKHPQDYQCAIKIKKYLENEYHWNISKDELMYLSLHLNRIHFSHK
ncbi:PRD domain-containing protein [Candidatus Stoquefichus massiliensis]|uniref:PRD domain-containing protein n=1 Tax=Candidatus Stoquefichus massiliensis TaxID=1470350 RepID=UPI00048173CC|nr:PRD domain-containing protein [Candidatus Stoquefichus massiliensis]